jgi:hypothetical protein
VVPRGRTAERGGVAKRGGRTTSNVA